MNKPFWGGVAFHSGHPRLWDTLFRAMVILPSIFMLGLPVGSIALSHKETGLGFSAEQRVLLPYHKIYYELFLDHLTGIS